MPKGEARALIEDSARGFSRLLRSVSDPDVIATGTWTIRDVAAHMVDMFDNYGHILQGEGSRAWAVDDIAAYNQVEVEKISLTRPHELADAMDELIETYLKILDSIEGNPIVPWVEGIPVPVSGIVCLGVAECLVHGYDIARASGQPWSIDPHAAALSARGISPITVHYVDEKAAAGLNACFDLRLRGEWQAHFVFADGVLSIEEPADRRVDVHISASPVPFMLVGYGRVSQWGPIMTGKIAAWGRRPLLALRFGSLLRNP